MRPHPPPGFHTAALCAAVFGTIMAAAVLALETSSGGPWGTLWMRAAAALLAALAAVVTEALWRPRPWAYRSTLALALVYTAVVTLLCLGLKGLEGLTVAFWILFFSAWVVLPIVIYVRNRAATLFGPQGQQRRPPPRGPHPQPTAPGGRPPSWG
jgi:hypothetical protein